MPKKRGKKWGFALIGIVLVLGIGGVYLGNQAYTANQRKVSTAWTASQIDTLLKQKGYIENTSGVGGFSSNTGSEDNNDFTGEKIGTYSNQTYTAILSSKEEIYIYKNSIAETYNGLYFPANAWAIEIMKLDSSGNETVQEELFTNASQIPSAK